jgi:hypothetical protein
MNSGALPDLVLLFVDWVAFLLDKEWGMTRASRSGSIWTLTLGETTSVTVDMTNVERPRLESSDETLDLLPIAEEARERARAGDVGDGCWYRMTLESAPTPLALPTHFLRVLNDHRRYHGTWAFADALLTIEEAEPEAKGLVLPRFTAWVIFPVAAPWPGPYGDRLAEAIGSFIRSAVVFATAAPLNPVPKVCGASVDEVAAAKQAADHPQFPIGQLPFGKALMNLRHPSGDEALRRVQGALFAYEEALYQDSEYVSLILLVSSMEALLVPNAGFRRHRMTKRFVEGVRQLSADKLSELMEHPNFEAAFPGANTPAKFLDELYESRSSPLHTGFVQRGVSLTSQLGGPGAQRVLIVSDLARTCILSFIENPFSSLFGHPTIDSHGDRPTT